MVKRKLYELFEEMHHGKYEFAEFMNGSIANNYEKFSREIGGRTKIILVPNKKLKIFHTFLNLFIFEFLPINENVVFSYRKGFSAYDAVSPHQNSKYFFQTDISSFFASISRELVKNTILAGKHACPVADLDEAIERILDLVCIENALPVGFPSSAPISNAIFYNFDNDFECFCKSSELIYTRYSDDIIISSNTKTNLNKIDAEIEKRLHEYFGSDFHLNQKKSKYFQVGGKIKILGMMILPNGRITIDSGLKRDLEVLLYTYLNDRMKFLALFGGEEDVGLGRVTGYLNYANSVDKEYLDKLRRKFGATTIDSILHRPLPKQKSKK
jgi:RNA-directed DNA polymerase